MKAAKSAITSALSSPAALSPAINLATNAVLQLADSKNRKSEDKESKKPSEPLSPQDLQASLTAIAARKRALFMKVFKDEFLRELNYLWEVANNRAQPRDLMVSKLVAPLNLIAGAMPVPWIGMVIQVFTMAAEFTGSQNREKRMTVVASLGTELDMAQLNILLDTVAREALRRYESFIVDRLSDDPEVGVVPFAKTGAQRMLEYISHHAIKSVDAKQLAVTLNESLLLAGLVEGQSGAWVDGFSNHELQLKQLSKKGKPQKIDAEDVYARAGLRQLEIKDAKLLDRIYVRDVPKHHESSEWKKFQSMRSKVKSFGDFGYVRYRRVKGEYHHQKDPQVGYVLMPLAVIQDRYDFQSQNLQILSPALQTEIKSSSHSMIRIDRGTIAQFIVWEKSHNGASLVDYVREFLHYPLLQQVICSDDLSGLKFTGLNLQHSDLSGAILDGDLTGTNLNHSYLVGTVFKAGTRAHKLQLHAAHCEYLQAEGVEFQGSDMTQGHFDYAQLRGVNLTGCKLLGAEWPYAVLTSVRSDVDLVQLQQQQITALQQDLQAQHEEFSTLTARINDELAMLQKTTQALSAQLEKEINPQLQGLSGQVSSLWQHLGDRLTFEAQCQSEMRELRAQIGRSQGAQEEAVRQWQLQLQTTQRQLKQLQAGDGIKTAMQGFTANFQQQLTGLESGLRTKLVTLEKQLQQNLHTLLTQQSQRIDELTVQMETLKTEVGALTQRVDALESWVQTVEQTLATQQAGDAKAKEALTVLQTAMQTLQIELQTEKVRRLEQEQQMIALREKVAAAPNAEQVRALQSQLQAILQLPEDEEIENKKEKPPQGLIDALLVKKQDAKRQKETFEKAAMNPTLRQKLQAKIDVCDQQMQKWDQLLASLTSSWEEQAAAQKAILLESQQAFNETCEARIQQLEVRVGKLEQWSLQAQGRLQRLEQSDSTTQAELKELRTLVVQWVSSQHTHQAQIEAVRQDASPGDGSRLAQLTQLQQQLKPAELDDTVRQKINALKAVYQEQQQCLVAAAEIDSDLSESLAVDQSAIEGKLDELTALETDFTQTQQAYLDQFRHEVQSAIDDLRGEVHDLKEKTKRIDGQVGDLEQKSVNIAYQIISSDPRHTLARRLQTLRQRVLDDKYINRELAYYIAPNGQSFPGSDASTPLFEWVIKNFLQSSVHTLLLQGPGGIGKSTFNRYLLHYLWKDPAWESFKPGDSPPKAFLPLFFPLGSNHVDPSHLFDYLRDLPGLAEDFTDAEINVLKSEYQILFIADGYDEMPGNIKINLYEANGLKQYQGRVRLLVSRRSDPALSSIDEKTYFIPPSHTPMKPLYHSYYVAPFSEPQTKAYIDQYLVQKHKEIEEGRRRQRLTSLSLMSPSRMSSSSSSSLSMRSASPLLQDYKQQPGDDDEFTPVTSLLLWQDSSVYLQKFKEISGIESLINTPFLLMITIETLPTIMQDVEQELAQQPQKGRQAKKLELTRKRLLAGFVENWFTRQAKEKALPAAEFLQEPRDFLGDDAVDEATAQSQASGVDVQLTLLKLGYLLFCQEFAKHLQAEQRVFVQFPDKPQRSRFEQKAVSSNPVETSSWVNDLFSSKDKDYDMYVSRKGSPLKTQRLGQDRIEYGFLHALLIDYFVSTIIDDQARKAAQETPAFVVTPTSSGSQIFQPLPTANSRSSAPRSSLPTASPSLPLLSVTPSWAASSSSSSSSFSSSSNQTSSSMLSSPARTPSALPPRGVLGNQALVATGRGAGRGQPPKPGDKRPPMIPSPHLPQGPGGRG